MELSGKVVDILPITSGTGKNGKAWKKQEFAIETPGQYPKTVCFSISGDKCETHGLTVGQDVTVHFDAESRAYNGRYYTELKAFKTTMNGYVTTNQQSSPPESNFSQEDGGLMF